MAHTNRAYGPKDIENSIIISKKELIAKKFPFQQVAIDTLFQNILAQENTILYGKGGYGKSNIIKEVCKTLNIPTVVIQCYADMPKESLIGTPHIKKYMEESIYETNFKDSPFMSQGVLILEEFLDADAEIVSIIKDILQEKGYRSNNKFLPYNIQAIVATGNKHPAEIALDNSTEALYNERFISHINMEWDTHSPEDYITLFKGNKIVISKEINLVAQACAENKVSPRIAITATKLIKLYGINTLLSMHAFQNIDIQALLHILYE